MDTNVDHPKYSLHLFAGAGGGLIADVAFGGIMPVCAVEIEDFPREILTTRFPNLPIWDDVRTFRADNQECADMFDDLRRVRDELCISGGFPCQDISSAGKRKGIRGERSGLWREFARIIREIRPGWVLAENSAYLTSRGLSVVLRDLAAMGYDAAWCVLGADEMGGLHQRHRIWITARLSDADSMREQQ